MGNEGRGRWRRDVETLAHAALLLFATLLGCDGAEPAPSPDAGVLGTFESGGDAGTSLAAPVPADAGAFGFRRDVHPLFVTHCSPCHVTNGPYHDIASPDVAAAYADAAEYADRIVARIRQGNMPPGCVFEASECVPEAALLVIERWIAEGLPQ